MREGKRTSAKLSLLFSEPPVVYRVKTTLLYVISVAEFCSINKVSKSEGTSRHIISKSLLMLFAKSRQN